MNKKEFVTPIYTLLNKLDKEVDQFLSVESVRERSIKFGFLFNLFYISMLIILKRLMKFLFNLFYKITAPSFSKASFKIIETMLKLFVKVKKVDLPTERILQNLKKREKTLKNLGHEVGYTLFYTFTVIFYELFSYDLFKYFNEKAKKFQIPQKQALVSMNLLSVLPIKIREDIKFSRIVPVMIDQIEKQTLHLIELSDKNQNKISKFKNIIKLVKSVKEASKDLKEGTLKVTFKELVENEPNDPDLKKLNRTLLKSRKVVKSAPNNPNSTINSLKSFLGMLEKFENVKITDIGKKSDILEQLFLIVLKFLKNYLRIALMNKIRNEKTKRLLLLYIPIVIKVVTSLVYLFLLHVIVAIDTVYSTLSSMVKTSVKDLLHKMTDRFNDLLKLLLMSKPVLE